MKAGIYASPTMPLDIVDLPEPPNSIGGGCNALGMVTGIYAVYPNDLLNWVSLSVETENPAGHYDVFWGDGTTSTHLSGTVATHQFVYANCVNPSRNGYKQAWVQIVPEVTCPIDNNIVGVNFQHQNPTGTPASNGGRWLRLAIKAPYIQSAIIGGDVIALSMLYTFVFYRDTRLDGGLTPYPMNNISSFHQMFKRCSALISVKGRSTYEGTVTKETFTSGGGDFSEMFYGCDHIKAHPVLYVTTSSGVDFSSMYAYCVNLVAVDGLDLRNATNLYMLFAHCTKLLRLPSSDNSATGTYILGTSHVVNFSYMFGWCSNLLYVPVMNTSNGENFSNMFYACYRLPALPAINTHKGTNFSYFAASCHKITDIPTLDTANGTNFSAMFYDCTLLGSGLGGTLRGFDTSKATNVSGIIQSCPSIVSAGFNWPLVTVSTSAFSGCYNLQNLSVTGIKTNVSIQQCHLYKNNLYAFITALPTITDGSSPAIFLYGNPALSDSTIGSVIALLNPKGWQWSGVYTSGV